MPGPGLRVAVLAVGALALSLPAHADYKESYKRGMELIERGNWAGVAQKMREAAAEQGKEGEPIKLYGMRFETYLPHYYLGLALLNSGDCAGALEAWRVSESQGAIKKAAQYKALVKDRTACEARLAQAAPKTPITPDPALAAVAAAESEVVAAENASGSVTALAADADLAPAWAKEASLGPAQKQAAELLTQAKAKLDAAKKKPEASVASEARQLAANAGKQFEAVRQAATTKRDEMRRAAQKAAEEKARRAEVLPLTPVQSPVAPGPPVQSPGTPGPTAQSPAASGPPAELRQGIRAYFGGQYGEAIQVLSGGQFQGKAALHALLIRAAARYALYASGGRKDESLKRDATVDIKACRRLDAGFLPDPQAFSPRFIEVFKATR